MNIIGDALDGLTPGRPLGAAGLSMFPLFARHEVQPGYVSLDEGLARGTVRVSEISVQGRVRELLVTNDEPWPVLILDGEELIGAKQDRILNLTILVPAKSRLNVPVSCVEAGRWQHRSRNFSSAKRAYYASGRAMKAYQVTESYRTAQRPDADQGAIWEDIALKSQRFSAYSPTSAMDIMYERNAVALERFERDLAPQPLQRGGIFVLGGDMLGMDVFDCPATWRKLLPKLAASYGLDALDLADNVDALHRTREHRFDPKALLSRVKALRQEHYPAVGLGEDVRLSGPDMHGGALVVGDSLLHLAAFSRVDRAGNGRLSDVA